MTVLQIHVTKLQTLKQTGHFFFFFSILDLNLDKWIPLVQYEILSSDPMTTMSLNVETSNKKRYLYRLVKQKQTNIQNTFKELISH